MVENIEVHLEDGLSASICPLEGFGLGSMTPTMAGTILSL